MNTKRLYESIMKNISRDIKKNILNETNYNIPKSAYPAPVIELQKLVKRYPKKARITVEQGEDDTNEWKVYIYINIKSFDFSWKVYITENSLNSACYEVYAQFIVDGLETEAAEDYMDIAEFKTEVVDVIQEAIRKPSLYNEYRY